jgi:hypothetical protein
MILGFHTFICDDSRPHVPCTPVESWGPNQLLSHSCPPQPSRWTKAGANPRPRRCSLRIGHRRCHETGAAGKPGMSGTGGSRPLGVGNRPHAAGSRGSGGRSRSGPAGPRGGAGKTVGGTAGHAAGEAPPPPFPPLASSATAPCNSDLEVRSASDPLGPLQPLSLDLGG